MTFCRYAFTSFQLDIRILPLANPIDIFSLHSNSICCHGNVNIKEKTTMDILKTLAEEFKIKEEQVKETVALIDEGNTIPYISR